MAQGKKSSTQTHLHRFNRQIVDSLITVKDGSREIQIMIITRTFRELERVWKDCGSAEVWNCIKSGKTVKEKSEDGL